jgi:hypothetical protein
VGVSPRCCFEPSRAHYEKAPQQCGSPLVGAEARLARDASRRIRSSKPHGELGNGDIASSRPFHRDRAFRRSPRAREGQDASVHEAQSHAPCETWLCADSLALWRGRGLAPLDAHPVQDEADTKE